MSEVTSVDMKYSLYVQLATVWLSYNKRLVDIETLLLLQNANICDAFRAELGFLSTLAIIIMHHLSFNCDRCCPFLVIERLVVMYRDHVTLAVLELIEAGTLTELQKTWWYEKGECSSKDGPPKKVNSVIRQV